MNHAVAHCINFLEVFYHPYLRVGEQAEYELHALCVLGYVVHYLFLLSAGQLYLYESTFEPYALSSA